MTEVKPQCTCKAISGDNEACPWHGIEAMEAYRAKHPLEMPGDYE